jgi:ubiquinone/menaquinone biosynthesis C-methylase UbiE
MSYRAFNTFANEYDDWFDKEPGTTIFNMEVESLRSLLNKYKRPYLEIGIGSGRFSQALSIEFGVDPAPALLEKAKAKGIEVWRASGEALPFSDHNFGCVLIALTLCFSSNPFRLLQEASRVLVPEGEMVLGMILKESPWAEFYVKRGKEGHTLYSEARFLLKSEIEKLLKLSGFTILRYCSTLFQPPGQQNYYLEHPFWAYRRSAGFIAISARKVHHMSENNGNNPAWVL